MLLLIQFNQSAVCKLFMIMAAASNYLSLLIRFMINGFIILSVTSEIMKSTHFNFQQAKTQRYSIYRGVTQRKAANHHFGEWFKINPLIIYDPEINFSSLQMTLHLCWNWLAQCHHRCREMLLSSLLSWVSQLGGEGHPGAPTSVRDHPAVGAKAKVKMRLKSVKLRPHNRRLFTRLHRWERPQLCLWPESVAGRQFCLRKLKTEHGWQRTSPRHNRMGKPMGWRAPLLVQIHQVWPTSPPYLPLQTPPPHLPLLLRTTWGPEASAQKVKQTNHPQKQVGTK